MHRLDLSLQPCMMVRYQIQYQLTLRNNTAKIEASTLIAIGVPFNFDIKNASMTPEITPITPPVDVRTTASVKN